MNRKKNGKTRHNSKIKLKQRLPDERGEPETTQDGSNSWSCDDNKARRTILNGIFFTIL